MRRYKNSVLLLFFIIRLLVSSTFADSSSHFPTMLTFFLLFCLCSFSATNPIEPEVTTFPTALEITTDSTADASDVTTESATNASDSVDRMLSSALSVEESSPAEQPPSREPLGSRRSPKNLDLIDFSRLGGNRGSRIPPIFPSSPPPSSLKPSSVSTARTISTAAPTKTTDPDQIDTEGSNSTYTLSPDQQAIERKIEARVSARLLNPTTWVWQTTPAGPITVRCTLPGPECEDVRSTAAWNSF